MESEQESSVSKCSVCMMMVTAMLTASAAVTLTVLLVSWGNMGLMGSPSITLGTCTETYFTNKYANLSYIISVTFVGSCVATLSSLILLFIVLGWACKSCGKGFQPSNCAYGGLFFFLALTIISAIPPAGYYLSFGMELNRCTNSSYDSTQVFTTLVLAASVLALAFILAIIILCLKPASSSQEKYRQVESIQTEPIEQKKPIVKRREPLPPAQPYDSKKQFEDRRSPIKVKEDDYTRQKLQITRENVYDSPSKRRIIKNDEPIYLERTDRRDRDLRDNFLQPRPHSRQEHNRDQNIVSNLHPSLRNMSPQKYLEHERQKKKYSTEEEDKFMKKEAQYYRQDNQDDHRGILSRGEFQERDRRDRRDNYGGRYDRRDDPINDSYEDRLGKGRNRDIDRGRDVRESPQRRRNQQNDRFNNEYHFDNTRRPSPDPRDRQGILSRYRKGY